MPPGVPEAFEHRHLVAHERQIVRAGQPRGAGTDHRNLLAARHIVPADGEERQVPGYLVALLGSTVKELVLGIRRERFGAVFLADETLEGADADRRIDFAAAAPVLAGRRTDAATIRRKGIR